MRTGVDNAVLVDVVRKIGVRGIDLAIFGGGERELEYLHARQSVAVPEGLHVGRDDAQVLRYDRQLVAQLAPERVQQLLPGTWHPLAVHGRVLACRDLPAGREAAEVVDADYVAHLQRLPDARDPPGESGPLVLAPSVKGVAPQLAGRGERIRRDPGGCLLMSLFVYLEKPGVRPCVDRIRCDEYGDVPYDPHAAAVGVFPEGGPLREEEVLVDLVQLDLFGIALPLLLQGLRVTSSESLVPDAEPPGVVVLVAQHLIEGVVVQPPCLLAAELLVVRGRLLEERHGGLPQKRHLDSARQTIVHPLARRRT